MGIHGEGTRTQLPNGRWRVAVTMADGQRVWRRARTERDAKRVQRELVEAREMDLDPTRQTLAAWLRSWIASLHDTKRRKLAPRTLEHYAMIVERHIIPGLDPKGKLPLARVTERRIQAWLDSSEGSDRSIHHRRAVLRLALNRAMRQRLLTHNPAAGKAIELRPATYHGAKPLTFAEAKALLITSEASRWHPLWRLAIVTGLRYGELMGLAWDDIGPDHVTVTAQLQRRNGTWVRTPTKTSRKVDSIGIDPETARILAEHRAKLASERTADWAYFGHVFLDERGRPYHHHPVLTAFHAACDTAGIPRRRFHDLRGSSATLLGELGVAEDTRMARLGHTTTEMARHYGKASIQQDREAVERLADALSG